MKYKYILLDSFTRTPFAGAQIAVFPHAVSLTDERKQLLAKELNLSETVFIQPSRKPSCDASIEIYSPSGQCDFAGHAMLAGCFVIGDTGLVQGSDARVEFNGSVMDAILGIKNQKVQIGIPVNDHYEEYVPSDAELAQLIGVDARDIGYNEYRPMIAGNPEPYLIVPLKNNHVLRAAQFNENKWQLSFVAPLARQILLFTGEHGFDSVNFAARVIGKGIGDREDPPIGGAAPALGLFLAYGKKDYHRSCMVQRGDADSRVSILEVNVDKKGETVMGVQLGGHVVKMGEGYFDLQD